MRIHRIQYFEFTVYLCLTDEKFFSVCIIGFGEYQLDLALMIYWLSIGKARMREWPID